MLDCISYNDMILKSVKRQGSILEIVLNRGFQKIIPVDERSVRVLYSFEEIREDNAEKPCLAELHEFSDWSYTEDDTSVTVRLPELIIKIDRITNSFTYYDGEGRLLLKEREKRSKELVKIPVFSLAGGAPEKEFVETADGVKEVIKDAGKIQTGSAYHTRLHFEFDKDEALYGLGQHEEGYHNLRGNTVYLNQANRTIAIPVFVSTRGYGVFVNTCSPSIFNDNTEGSYFYTEADEEMDFFFMNGGGMDGVIREFRKITGKAVMLPKWAFGYIQSQERYETQEEILDVANKYREKGIGLDCIVLDWISWPDGQWGQKSFDPNRFPDPDGMTDKLHKDHVHFMISIWPNMDNSCDNITEFKEKKLLLPAINIYNALDAKAREIYWKQAYEGLFRHGIDAWWCDNSEPICPEWMQNVRPENSKNYEEYCRSVSNHLPAPYMNAFGLYHAMGIYEGQRKDCQSKRVVNLTRSGYPGQQRFGTILWSGDISASWNTLKKQIAASLHFCASGMPYWTIDIGAFFVKNGFQWYWNGDYDDGTADPAYCELFTRWYQWGAFLPVFRGHGTDVRRELWNFDNSAAGFYQALVEANKRRYELMPYIYSLAGNVHLNDGLIIRPLVFEFTGDPNVRDIFDQYMFGDEMMVCPVTEAMYFGQRPAANSGIGTNATELKNENIDYDGHAQGIVTSDPEIKDEVAVKHIREIYLPAGCYWYDYYTDRKYAGGQWIEADAPLEKIPVFIKAGSIIPMTEAALSVEELSDDITLHVYPGADGKFTLYNDAGDGYEYENGAYTLRRFTWNDRDGELLEDDKPVSSKYVIHG